MTVRVIRLSHDNVFDVDLILQIIETKTNSKQTCVVDLCLDDDVEESDELRPGNLQALSPHTRHVSTERQRARNNGDHLCLELTGNVLCSLVHLYVVTFGHVKINVMKRPLKSHGFRRCQQKRLLLLQKAR